MLHLFALYLVCMKVYRSCFGGGACIYTWELFEGGPQLFLSRLNRRFILIWRKVTYCFLYHWFLITSNCISKFYSFLAHVISMPVLKTDVLDLSTPLICSLGFFIHINHSANAYFFSPRLLLGPFLLICFC